MVLKLSYFDSLVHYIRKKKYYSLSTGGLNRNMSVSFPFIRSIPSFLFLLFILLVSVVKRSSHIPSVILFSFFHVTSASMCMRDLHKRCKVPHFFLPFFFLSSPFPSPDVHSHPFFPTVYERIETIARSSLALSIFSSRFSFLFVIVCERNRKDGWGNMSTLFLSLFLFNLPHSWFILPLEFSNNDDVNQFVLLGWLGTNWRFVGLAANQEPVLI